MTTTVDGLVEMQANDPGLWFQAKMASEAYLQNALRNLHSHVESQAAEITRLTAELESAKQLHADAGLSGPKAVPAAASPMKMSPFLWAF